MRAEVVYLSLLDVAFVQEGLMRAYDLLAACEHADKCLVADEIQQRAGAFREWLEEAH